MLALTENAQSAIRGIADQAELPETGGVRIAMAESNQLEMTLVPEPQGADEVIEAEGARVFVEETASTLLAEQELDAGQTPDGIGFALRPQNEA